MTMAWVRAAYGVPAKRGGRVIVDGHPGRILSAVETPHLAVRLDDGRRVYAHPTWHMEYLHTAWADPELRSKP